MSADELELQSCFIDSNIWLYTFIKNQDLTKAAQAKTLIQKSSVVVSTQVINEVCVNLVRKTKLPENEIQQLIYSFYRRYRVINLTQDILLQASKLRQRYHFSYWDSVILAAALSANLPVLYSEDMQHNMIVEDKLTIINPFQPSSA